MAARTIVIVSSAVAALAGAVVIARLAGYRLGPSTFVRCRQGHLSTTVWIPGIKLKGLDFGIARFQRCPVGGHWSLVVPVREADLTDEQRRAARERHDTWIP